jgi:hypothetical protein
MGDLARLLPLQRRLARKVHVVVLVSHSSVRDRTHSRSYQNNLSETSQPILPGAQIKFVLVDYGALGPGASLLDSYGLRRDLPEISRVLVVRVRPAGSPRTEPRDHERRGRELPSTSDCGKDYGSGSRRRL